MKTNTKHVFYYEGILQLRDAKQEIVDYVLNDINKNKVKGVKLAKWMKVKGGLDFYINSKHYLQSLGKKLLNVFGGELNSSPQLFTKDHQSGKETYRLNLHFKPSGYKKKDIVIYKEQVYQVTSCSKRLNLINLKTGQRDFIRYDSDIKKAEPIFKTMVTKIYPKLEILDPETYQSVNPMNKKECKLGENVKVVKINDAIWLI